MEENNPDHSNQSDSSNSEYKIPDSVVVIEPEKKEAPIKSKSDFSFSKPWQILGYVITAVGTIASCYFAWQSIRLTEKYGEQRDTIDKLTELVDRQDQSIGKLTTLIEKQDGIINETKSTNEGIRQTQEGIYSLLTATYRQNENFIKSNQPIVRIRIKGNFESKPGNTNPHNPCFTSFEYFLENLSNVPAKNFSGKVNFIRPSKGGYESFYNYASWRDEFVDLTKENPIEINSIFKEVTCEQAQMFFECFVVFEYSYLHNLSNKMVKDIVVLRHYRSENYNLYYMKPVDKGTENKIKNWYQSAQLEYTPPA